MLDEVRSICSLLEQVAAPPAPAMKAGGKRAPPSRWMTTKEVAELFCVSAATVSRGVGVFARLRRVPVTEKRVIYVVRAGDTLWSIATRFSTTVDRLKRLNNLTSRRARDLQVGQRLAVKDPES